MSQMQQSISTAEIESLFEYLVGLEIPAHDYRSFTYVTSGNGIGQVETATYKTGGSGGTIVAILTLTYDSFHRISSVTKT